MDAIDIVGQELIFHVRNKGITSKGELYENGFIDGLIHIHNLLIKTKSESIEYNSEECCCMDEKDTCPHCEAWRKGG